MDGLLEEDPMERAARTMPLLDVKQQQTTTLRGAFDDDKDDRGPPLVHVRQAGRQAGRGGRRRLSLGCLLIVWLWVRVGGGVASSASACGRRR